MQVDSRAPRQFGNRETSFLRGYANLLAAAVDRIRATADLHSAHAALKVHEAALNQSNKLEAIGQLTGGVAHDFNNLLTIIRSATDFLRRDNLSEDRRLRYLEAISETVDRATKLTGQLLSFARQQALQPVAFDVGKRVHLVIDLLSTLLGSRIKIETELCDPACFAQADVNQFETALVNLVVNARDAMNGEGRLTIKVKPSSTIPAVRAHQEAPGDFVSISVTDTGSGIAADKIAKIFEPFFTTKELGKGTGLGLSQVFGFTKQSNGQVDVQSILGQGSTFTIFLPHSAPVSDTRKKEPQTVARGSKGGPTRILVVEDNETVGQFAKEMLQDLGYRPVWASNADEALGLLARNDPRFDLVFSDVILPGMNGIELAEVVRKKYPGLPVVLASGYSNVLAEEGTHGFQLVHKPYSVDTLLRAIQNAMDVRTEP